MTGKNSLGNVETSSSGGSSQGGSGGQGRGGHGGQGGRGGRGGGRGGNSSNTPEYKDITCHCCQKTGHIASHGMASTDRQ